MTWKRSLTIKKNIRVLYLTFIEKVVWPPCATVYLDYALGETIRNLREINKCRSPKLRKLRLVVRRRSFVDAEQ